jgi:hypothetical protein
VTDGTTLLFGLPGVNVERVERLADGTRVVHAVTAGEAAAACPSCGVVSTSVKARVTISPRDIRTARTELSCGGTRPAGAAAKTTAAVLVHRVDTASPGAGANHRAVAYPDRRGDRLSGYLPPVTLSYHQFEIGGSVPVWHIEGDQKPSEVDGPILDLFKHLQLVNGPRWIAFRGKPPLHGLACSAQVR